MPIDRSHRFLKPKGYPPFGDESDWRRFCRQCLMLKRTEMLCTAKGERVQDYVPRNCRHFQDNGWQPPKNK